MHVGSYELPREGLFCQELCYFVEFLSHSLHRLQLQLQSAIDARVLQSALLATFQDHDVQNFHQYHRFRHSVLHKYCFVSVC